MARSQASYSKKEKEKNKAQKRQEKQQRKDERKANAKSSTSLDDMLAYVDENGNITSTPPDPTKKRAVNSEDIVIGARNQGSSAKAFSGRQGKVTFFNASKGFGFIKDDQSHESIFVHTSALTTPIKENDLVSFETQHGPKGPVAVNVKKI